MHKAIVKPILLGIASLMATAWAGAQNPFENNGFDDPYDENSEFYDPNDPNVAFYNQQDSMPEINANSIPVHVDMWHVDGLFGDIEPVEVDTTYHYFYNSFLEDGRHGTYNFLGNLGAPRYSRIYFDREDAGGENIFLTPYSVYTPPEQFDFVNTKSPFTKLQYYKGGSKNQGEELFNAYFGLSANKRFSTGFNIDYVYGRGYYQAQSTAHLAAAYFASYIGDRYQANLLFNYFRTKMRENGGITDDRYITDPVSMNEGRTEYTSSDIPIRFADNNAWNTNKDFYVFLTHRYNLGFTEEHVVPVDTTRLPKDSVMTVTEFVPVTSFIHTMKVERGRRNFLSYGMPEDFFANRYMPGDSIDDNFHYLSVSNTLALSLNEGFKSWSKFGLRAFATYKIDRFTMIDSVAGTARQYAMRDYTQHDFSVGGELSKEQGSLVHYRARGEVFLLGSSVGDFDVSGDLDFNFRLLGDTVRLGARAGIGNHSPKFYYDNYHSKNFWWDNSFAKEWRFGVGGRLDIDRWRTHLSVDFENIKNYLYFNGDARAAQYGGNVQVFAAKLRQDFKLGIFHLDNEIAYQKSSNDAVLPLPAWSLYHNFYLSAAIFKKVLRVEIGADLRYFTSYYAEAYNPATGQFHVQPDAGRVRIGGYPVINVYANLFLKRTRMFAMLSHINSGSGNANAFHVPHYPLPSMLFRIGISWIFYD